MQIVRAGDRLVACGDLPETVVIAFVEAIQPDLFGSRTQQVPESPSIAAQT